MNTKTRNLVTTALIPGIFNILWLFDLITNDMLKICLISSAIYFLFPFLFKYSEFCAKEVIFLSYISFQSKQVIQHPEKVELYATRNFYVTYHDWSEDKDVSLGVWHILPNYVARTFSEELGLDENEKISAVTRKKNRKFELAVDDIAESIKSEFPKINSENEAEFYERMLNVPNAKIVLYMHGSTGSRAKTHRILLYNMLREHGYHIIAFDYRGYGDSIPTTIALNESGVVHDAIAVYNYIISITKNPVYIWSHSLGTGISCHLLSAIKKLEFFAPRALVLESPFNNMSDEVAMHPLTIPFRFLPWFQSSAVKGIENYSQFRSDKHISEFPQPILIMHAEDDFVIPFKLGYDLYLEALDKRPTNWGAVEFRKFRAERGLGHSAIDTAPEIPDIINSFFDKYEDKRFENKIY